METLTQQRKEAVLEWLRRPKPRDASGDVISHSQLRNLEKAFTNRVYFEGTPFVPWKPIQERVGKRRGWNEFRHRFQEHIYVAYDNQEWTYKPDAEIKGESHHTYLKLETVLQDSRMYDATYSLRHPRGDVRGDVRRKTDLQYAVHRGSHVNGVFYKTPDRYGVGGIYVLHCGLAPSSNHDPSHDPDFTLKIGRSQNILQRLHQHHGSNSPISQLGVVKFLFGVEMDTCYQVPAEYLIKDLLKGFGFTHLNEGQSIETFSFQRKCLPLIHDIVCALRYVYDPPIKRVMEDLEDSAENPLLEQGLPRELHTPVQRDVSEIRVGALGSLWSLV